MAAGDIGKPDEGHDVIRVPGAALDDEARGSRRNLQHPRYVQARGDRPDLMLGLAPGHAAQQPGPGSLVGEWLIPGFRHRQQVDQPFLMAERPASRQVQRGHREQPGRTSSIEVRGIGVPGPSLLAGEEDVAVR